MTKPLLFLCLALCFASCKKNETAPPGESSQEASNKPKASTSAAIPPDFSIALLPDIQFTTDPGPEGGLEVMLTKELKWIIDNRAAENIVYVGGLGDISDSGDQTWSDPQWDVVQRNFYGNKTGHAKGLETPLPGFPFGIPYGLCTGNHDQRNPDEGPTKPCAKYNAKLGRSHFANTAHPYYGGSYTTANNNNHYQKFSVGVSPNKMDFMVINLNYDLNYDVPAVTQWAYNLSAANPNTKVIVITHYLSSTAIPAVFSKQGLAIWNKLKGLENVFMFAGGHITGEGYREDTYDGHTIKTFQTDYQNWDNGGEGFFRLMKFSAANNTISVRTYSPYRTFMNLAGAWQTDANSQFTKPWFDAPLTTPIADGKYKIVARNTGAAARVLTVYNASTISDKVVLWDYTGPVANDEWNLTKIGTTGYYKITNVNSGLDLNVSGGLTDNGTQIIQYGYTSTLPNNDEWKIVDVGGGYHKIISRHSAKGLNVFNADTANGTNIILWDYVNLPNMQFQLVSVP